MKVPNLSAFGLCALLAPSAALAQDPAPLRVEIVDARGTVVGEALLRQTTAGAAVLVELRVEGLTPGLHGFHIHETGRCEAPSFESAGGHFAPHGRGHGIFASEGLHGGDLLNLRVPESGSIHVERLATGVTLDTGPATLLDDDGSALVIHAQADDYRSQPSGDAGSRVACGVVGR